MTLQRKFPWSMRLFAEQLLSRAAGAALIGGNQVRLLRDAEENYPAWLQAIGEAQRIIYFENYIIADDHVGRQFAAALAERARAGVTVRVLYDWMGALGVASRRVLRPVIEAGGEVRCFNPPRFDAPFGWLIRDHRKTIVVDGEIGFVTGLCVSRKWTRQPGSGIDPWRDTGIEIRGPAVSDILHAFVHVWSETGAPIPDDEWMSLPAPDEGHPAPIGDVSLRVLATVPNAALVYRLDQLIASVARKTLWLTDAYFIGVPPYVQALRAAALDGVDVRLLVPGVSDLPVVSSFSRAGYRPLLEAGIRVFEWNGPMLHAKTAVADSSWARVGSSNLNLASWIGNYELDVAVEDREFALCMERMYEKDLQSATEIVLAGHKRVRAREPRRPHGRSGGGSAGRAAAGALRIGNTVSAVLTNRRILGPAEAGLMTGMGLGLLALSAVAVLWPPFIMLPLALLGVWLAASFLIKAMHLRAQARKPLEEGHSGGASKPAKSERSRPENSGVPFR